MASGLCWDALWDALARLEDARRRVAMHPEGTPGWARAVGEEQAATLDADDAREACGLLGAFLFRVAADRLPGAEHGIRLEYLEGLTEDLAGCVKVLGVELLGLRQEVKELRRAVERAARDKETVGYEQEQVAGRSAPAGVNGQPGFGQWPIPAGFGT